jgi:fructose-bisphosphate aldolase class I
MLFSDKPGMSAPEMEATIRALLVPGKGILAADESFPSIEKRFASIGIPSTEENRRGYREMLFTTPRLGEFISGVILFDETLRQSSRKGGSMQKILQDQQIVPGIKVDGGTVPLPNSPGEKMTAGLDGLPERLAEYYQLGARFTKWRAVFTIGEERPSRACLVTNARSLALYAAASQNAGMVPIVEPEVLMDGAHPMSRCEQVIQTVLADVFDALFDHRVSLEHLLLKSGMVLPGSSSKEMCTDAEVAQATLRCFRRAVPAAVPGIVFLSGGQEDVPATSRLNEVGKANPGLWRLTFSYGRALQNPALHAWQGLSGNVKSAQQALYHRARCNGLATLGTYTASAEV